MCSVRRIISEIAIISVMLMISLLESKKICIVYITIVASGYSLRENIEVNMIPYLSYSGT